MLNIPEGPQIIPTTAVPKDARYRGLRIVHCQVDPSARDHYANNRYQFQHQSADYTPVWATLCLKGVKPNYRLVAFTHLSMKQFIDLVKYNPYDPPSDDYNALDMMEAHKQTQSDFKGQKKQNMYDFRNYLLEGIQGNRTLFLPTISGWQSRKDFGKTVFVAFDEQNEYAMYGRLYLPKLPIMQADGQTQTAAIFMAARTVDAVNAGAFETMQVTLEIELNLNSVQAGQSFADRNGRGSKKNRNLVIHLDTSSPLSSLRVQALEGTAFQGRLADGRTTGTSESATPNIVDLSTMEQMLLVAMSNGRLKTEHFKYHHVAHFLPYCKEFVQLLDERFSPDWLEVTPSNKDPFRRLYVHGWPFALKALAKAYHQVRIDKLGPLAAAIGTEDEVKDPRKSIDEKFQAQVDTIAEKWSKQPPMTFEEFSDRLGAIDWLRYRKHWILLTGCAIKAGGKRTFKLKETGEEKVKAQAPNTAVVIDKVADKILSSTWTDLCGDEDEPLV